MSADRPAPADRQVPYGRPTDPGKRHSHALTDGPDRAAARAMLKAVGFTDDDLAQPIIGVATTWIETMPCNLNQRRLAEFVKQGIRAAGGTPMEFNTISISDGVSMGTEGMKTSLVSREVIADSIELVARGHLFDGLVCLVGCDKTIPAAAMAAGPARHPGPHPLQRHDLSRAPTRASRQTWSRCSRRSGPIEPEDHAGRPVRDENGACPGAGACGGQFTANTMSTVLEFLGLSPAGLNGIPAEDPSKDEAARRCGELVMDPGPVTTSGPRTSSPGTRSRTRSRRCPRPAAAPTRALHLPAIAAEYGIPLTLDDFERRRGPDAADRRHAPGRPISPPPTCTRPAAWRW